MTCLTAADGTILAQLAGTRPELREKRRAVLKSLSPGAQRVARVLLGDSDGAASEEDRRAAEAILTWAERQR